VAEEEHHHRHERIHGVEWTWTTDDASATFRNFRRHPAHRRYRVGDFGLNTVGETATASVAWLDQTGAPFTPAGPTTVTSDDTAGAVATMVPAADGKSAQFTAVGDGVVNVTFEAANNEGVPVTATGALTVAIAPPPPPADLASGDVTWAQP
jgi:hypothetical protein